MQFYDSLGPMVVMQDAKRYLGYDVDDTNATGAGAQTFGVT
jgi:hypothetical protein